MTDLDDIRLGKARLQSSDGYYGGKSQEQRQRDPAYDPSTYVYTDKLTAALASDGAVLKLTHKLLNQVANDELPSATEIKKLCLMSGFSLMAVGNSADFKAGLGIVMRLGLKEETGGLSEEEAREQLGL